GLDEDAVAVRRAGASRGTRDETQAAPAFDDDAPALLRFAAADTANGGQPRLSVVLIDDGKIDAPVAAASSIPFPVTIAIDPEMPQARNRAARWRAAGYEIAAMARLPDNAAPSDVETAYDTAFETLPETVALLDAGGAGLTSDNAVTARALERLAQDGRGLAALSEGLATPLRQARGQGVPAVEIYRDLGQVGQDDRVIRRFLDQAAFRARQQGAVALMGRLNPETITALTLWGNRTDREGVAPAPLSALLQMQGTGLAK
ncbi:divergent polysaccharide deacetylase family protein, partial [Limimaricola sp. ASW11-118]